MRRREGALEKARGRWPGECGESPKRVSRRRGAQGGESQGRGAGEPGAGRNAEGEAGQRGEREPQLNREGAGVGAAAPGRLMRSAAQRLQSECDPASTQEYTNSWPLFDITPVSPQTSKSQVRKLRPEAAEQEAQSQGQAPSRWLSWKDEPGAGSLHHGRDTRLTPKNDGSNLE